MKQIKILLCWLVAILLEAFAVRFIFEENLTPGLLCHVVASCIFLISLDETVARRGRRGVQALVVFLLPAFGILVAFLMEVLARSVEPTGIAEDFQEFVRRSAVSADLGSSASFTSDRIREQIDVMPLEETLDTNDFMLKRQALDRLARRCNPKSVYLLKKALEDEHPDIRFYASGALSRIEAQVSNSIRDAERTVSLEPKSATARKILANCYYDYVYMGLLDESLKAEYRDRAIDAYRKSLELDPEQPSLLVRLARVLLENRQWAEAKVHLNKALEIDPDLTQAWLWRAETHFADGNIEEAAADCRRAMQAGEVPETVESVLKWLAAS